MAGVEMPHSGHNKHLCYLSNLGFQDRKQKEYDGIVRDPKYVCRQCGRAARRAKNLCKPRKISERAEQQ